MNVIGYVFYVLAPMNNFGAFVVGQTEQVNYIGDIDGAYTVDDNWEVEGQPVQHRAPTANDIAHIPKNKSCRLGNGGTGVAYRLEIDGSTETTDFGGILKIEQGCTLKIYGNTARSKINGEVRFVAAQQPASAPVIEFQTSHTFQKTIADPNSPPRVLGDVRGILRGTDPNHELTLGDQEEGLAALELSGDMDIEIKLANYGVVDAHHPTRQDPKPRITLKTYAKSGSGKWKATQGELIVDIDVDGAGTWEAGQDGLIQINDSVSTTAGGVFRGLRNGKVEVNAVVSGAANWELGIDAVDTAPEIEINEACSGLSGLFTMARGLLDVNAGFCSDGQAALYSNSSQWTTVIDVAPQTVLKFSGGCP